MSNNDTLSAAGSILAARRQIEVHECEHCGKKFVGIKKAKYCSGKCRTAACRERRKKNGAPEGGAPNLP